MKKIMFALAATVAIDAFAIESANTVGYQTFTCQPNTWYLFGAQFENANGTSMTIQQFRLPTGLVRPLTCPRLRLQRVG